MPKASDPKAPQKDPKSKAGPAAADKPARASAKSASPKDTSVASAADPAAERGRKARAAKTGSEIAATDKEPPHGLDEHTQATGHDHPSQVDGMRQLLEKKKNAQAARAGGPPQHGFGGKSRGFNPHNGPHSGPPRRTQGKGG